MYRRQGRESVSGYREPNRKSSFDWLKKWSKKVSPSQNWESTTKAVKSNIYPLFAVNTGTKDIVHRIIQRYVLDNDANNKSACLVKNC